MAAPSSHMWYVKAAGGVWGPYPEARIFDFVAEGRVRAATPVSPWAAGPFHPACDAFEFARLFTPAARPEPARPPPARPPPASPSPARPSPALPEPARLEPARPAPAARAASGGAAAAAAYPAAALPDPQAAPAPAMLAQAGPTRPILVWAQLSAASAPNFMAILGAAGRGATIRPGLWLVQARTSAATLRNLLSRRLGASDILLVVEAPLDQVAWFNLEPARDRELRRLWSAT